MWFAPALFALAPLASPAAQEIRLPRQPQVSPDGETNQLEGLVHAIRHGGVLPSVREEYGWREGIGHKEKASFS